MQYGNCEIPDGEVLIPVADALQINPDIIAGFLVVGIDIEGSAYVLHNSCCLAHFINGLVQYMRDNPGLNQTNPGLKHLDGE